MDRILSVGNKIFEVTDASNEISVSIIRILFASFFKNIKGFHFFIKCFWCMLLLKWKGEIKMTFPKRGLKYLKCLVHKIIRKENIINLLLKQEKRIKEKL